MKISYTNTFISTNFHNYLKRRATETLREEARHSINTMSTSKTKVDDIVGNERSNENHQNAALL